eukprot:GSChrysophyteH2.ASY1.ANO1.618.1 assembled CDS
MGIPMSDKISMFLLLVLYTLQGIPMGLCMSLPIILKERGASYDDLTLLSLASTPFSLKLLWAPLVDTVFFKSIGRRKTWLVPIQLLTGLIMIVFAPMVVQWLGGDVNTDTELVQTPTAFPLALFLLVIYFLMATQDIAVDGWALTMLSPANVGYASTCNSIGQTFGAFMANQGFISLMGETMATLSSFMSLAGYVFIVVTVAIALLKTEAPLPREEEPTGITETYKQIGGLLHLAPVQKLLLILLTVKMSFAPADSVAIFEMQEHGMPKADWATFSPVTMVIGLVLPALIANWVSRDPLHALKLAIPLKLCTTALYWVIVNAVPAAYASEDGPGYDFFAVFLVVMVLHTAFDVLIFSAFMSFFNKISDPIIGGTYMTFLNSASNLGYKWTNTLVVWCTGRVSNFTSTYIGGDMDGYTIITIVCVSFGFFWMYAVFPMLKQLESVRREDWWVSTTTNKRDR